MKQTTRILATLVLAFALLPTPRHLSAKGLTPDVAFPPQSPRFTRGDCDADGTVAGTVADALFLLRFNFLGGRQPACLAACDADGSGEVHGTILDAVYLINFSFLDGPAPAAPYPECGGADGSDLLLGCGSSACDEG